jgi:putative transposase
MIEQNSSFGYRTMAYSLNFNTNTVQRVFQVKGWQVRKRPVGFRPSIQALPSVVKAPDERWATDLCRIWTGKDGWSHLAVVKANNRSSVELRLPNLLGQIELGPALNEYSRRQRS